MSSANELEGKLHERLLARDPVASEEIAAQFLEPVRRYVRRRAQIHVVFDSDLINDATVDAVFDYIRHPDKYSPAKSSLLTYLNLAAERDLINAVKKDRRRRLGEELSANVELTVIYGNKESDVQKIRREMDNALFDSTILKEPLQRMVGAIQSRRDQDLIRMMIGGERRTSAFAETLGIADIPIDEQRRIVKRHKDRLKQQLKRAGGKRRG